MAHGRPTARSLSALVRSAALALAVGAASAQPVAPPTWNLDPTHTAVHWEVVHMGTSTIRGRFGAPIGSVQFDPKGARLEASFSIDTATVSSGVPVLDVLLKGKELLDVADYPQAYFVAKTARFEGEAPRELRGEFTLRGISEPLSLRATRWNCALSPVFRRTVCGGDFEGEIVRSKFGITHSLPFVSDTVRLLVEIEAIAP